MTDNLFDAPLTTDGRPPTVGDGPYGGLMYPEDDPIEEYSSQESSEDRAPEEPVRAGARRSRSSTAHMEAPPIATIEDEPQYAPSVRSTYEDGEEKDEKDFGSAPLLGKLSTWLLRCKCRAHYGVAQGSRALRPSLVLVEPAQIGQKLREVRIQMLYSTLCATGD